MMEPLRPLLPKEEIYSRFLEAFADTLNTDLTPEIALEADKLLIRLWMKDLMLIQKDPD